MRTTIIASAAVAPLSLAAITIAATAVAASPTTGSFGMREQLYDGGGAVITGWTVTDLKPSSDVIPYLAAGKLYEATATVEADQGSITPIVSNFNAQASDGTTYRVLAGVATPQGVNPSSLPQGAKSTGKIYFDVTGASPSSVVYNDGAQDLLIWTGGSAPAAAPASGAPAAPPATPPPAAPPSPAPAAAPTSTPAAAPAAAPAASGSLPSGTNPSGGSTSGVSGTAMSGSASGVNPSGGTTTGVTGTNMSAGAGAGGNPAGKT